MQTVIEQPIDFQLPVELFKEAIASATYNDYRAESMMVTYDDPVLDMSFGHILVPGTQNKVILFPDKTIGYYVAGKPQPIFFEVSEPDQEFVNASEIPTDLKAIVNDIPEAYQGEFIAQG